MNQTSRRRFLAAGMAAPAACRTSRPETAHPPLRYRVLGKTGLKVTELGFGSEAVSDVSVFERALEVGINFFDTARSYQGGNAEGALGAALRNRRNDVVLSTRSYADNARQMQADLETSLRELRTDTVDIWYIGHKERPEQITGEMLSVQAAAQKAGKVRFRGLSTHRIGAMADFAIAQGFDVVQIPYSFAIGTARDPFNMNADGLDAALNKLKAANIGVVAMKVMAGGYPFRRVKEKNADIHARAGARVAAIRWALRDGRVQTTSVRMSDMDQLNENLQAMSGVYSEEDRRLLAAYTEAVSPVLCRMCGACDGRCPKGMPVSDIVRCVMYAEAYGQYEMGRERFALEAGEIRCGECLECAVTCPNGVRIRERMERARRLFC